MPHVLVAQPRKSRTAALISPLSSVLSSPSLFGPRLSSQKSTCQLIFSAPSLPSPRSLKSCFRHPKLLGMGRRGGIGKQSLAWSFHCSLRALWICTSFTLLKPTCIGLCRCSLWRRRCNHFPVFSVSSFSGDESFPTSSAI